ncbi:toll/interleukin-1 receptor domain-containing protein [Rufibacter immobilis]|uniref:toll/interleukin-1 receptor domain-containing protein n=1 Tax=Rufibacter immobilis TaxID=1348778 RepID=UPI0035EC7E06
MYTLSISPSMQNAPTLFLSYSWANQKEAEKIYTDLSQIGIEVKKDTNDLQYKDSIKDFMLSIRENDFALLLISGSYLKSKNCLFEASQLLKEKDVQKKILPVIIDKTNIFKLEDRIEYISYWQSQKVSLEDLLKSIEPINAIEAYNDLKTVTEITLIIDSFLKELSNMKTISFTELQGALYLPVLQAMGIEDVTWATDLLEIASYKDDIAQRELGQEKYLLRHNPNSHFYSIKARTYVLSKKYNCAELSFQQALKLDSENYEALNNLGQLYEHHFKDYGKARECYEKAIDAKPDLTVARLNLGVLLNGKFKDATGAKRQYDEILKYDPNEPRAHNNLANFYNKIENGPSGTEQFLYHIKKALELNPSYVEALISYGNYLKINGKIEEGNKVYRKAKKLDKNKLYTPIINSLLKTTKG